jgi:hypothetical protein
MYGVAHYFARSQRSHSTPSLDLFDFDPDIKLVPVFMTTVYFHLVMLRVFERSLLPYTGGRLTLWQAQLSEAETNYATKVKFWEPLLSAGAGN